MSITQDDVTRWCEMYVTKGTLPDWDDVAWMFDAAKCVTPMQEVRAMFLRWLRYTMGLTR